MNPTKKSQQGEEQERFWEAYRGCAEENRVPPDRSGCNVATTMLYTHVLNRPGISVKSPADI